MSQVPALRVEQLHDLRKPAKLTRYKTPCS